MLILPQGGSILDAHFHMGTKATHPLNPSRQSDTDATSQDLAYSYQSLQESTRRQTELRRRYQRNHGHSNASSISDLSQPKQIRG